MGETTTIQVRDETADRLHDRKGRGETYDDVVTRLLDETGRDTRGDRGGGGGDEQAVAVGREPAAAPGDAADGERELAEQRIRALADTLEGDGAAFEARLDAVLSIYDHLRAADRGRRRGELKEFVAEEEIDVGYAGGFESLWGNWIKANSGDGRPNLLTELPDVELRGSHYTHTGE